MNGEKVEFHTIQAMKIHVLVTDKLFDTGLASVLDLNGDGNPLDDILGMAGKLLR